MLGIRKEKFYGVARNIGEFRGDVGDLVERWKLQRDRIATGAMVGNRLGYSAPVIQWNVVCLSAGYATGQLPCLRVAFSNLSAAVSIPSGRRA